MRKVAEEMKKSYRVIADEFNLCNFHLQMGRARNQVLQDLGSRTGVDDLRALASILIQADKFGSSIATARADKAIQCACVVSKWPKKRQPRRQ